MHRASHAVAGNYQGAANPRDRSPMLAKNEREGEGDQRASNCEIEQSVSERRERGGVGKQLQVGEVDQRRNDDQRTCASNCPNRPGIDLKWRRYSRIGHVRCSWMAPRKPADADSVFSDTTT